MNVIESRWYQEEVDVIVVLGVSLAVHAEGSVYVSQVMVVIQLLEGLVGELSCSMEALPQVVT